MACSPGEQNPVCYHVIWSRIDWAHPTLSRCTLFTASVHDCKESVTAGFLEILENHDCGKILPSAILFPVTMEGRVRVQIAVGGRQVRRRKNFLSGEVRDPIQPGGVTQARGCLSELIWSAASVECLFYSRCHRFHSISSSRQICDVVVVIAIVVVIIFLLLKRRRQQAQW